MQTNTLPTAVLSLRPFVFIFEEAEFQSGLNIAILVIPTQQDQQQVRWGAVPDLASSDLSLPHPAAAVLIPSS